MEMSTLRGPSHPTQDPQAVLGDLFVGSKSWSKHNNRDFKGSRIARMWIDAIPLLKCNLNDHEDDEQSKELDLIDKTIGLINTLNSNWRSIAYLLQKKICTLYLREKYFIEKELNFDNSYWNVKIRKVLSKNDLETESFRIENIVKIRLLGFELMFLLINFQNKDENENECSLYSLKNSNEVPSVKLCTSIPYIWVNDDNKTTSIRCIDEIISIKQDSIDILLKEHTFSNVISVLDLKYNNNVKNAMNKLNLNIPNRIIFRLDDNIKIQKSHEHIIKNYCIKNGLSFIKINILEEIALYLRSYNMLDITNPGKHDKKIILKRRLKNKYFENLLSSSTDLVYEKSFLKDYCNEFDSYYTNSILLLTHFPDDSSYDMYYSSNIFHEFMDIFSNTLSDHLNSFDNKSSILTIAQYMNSSNINNKDDNNNTVLNDDNNKNNKVEKTKINLEKYNFEMISTNMNNILLSEKKNYNILNNIDFIKYQLCDKIRNNLISQFKLKIVNKNSRIDIDDLINQFIETHLSTYNYNSYETFIYHVEKSESLYPLNVSKLGVLFAVKADEYYLTEKINKISLNETKLIKPFNSSILKSIPTNCIEEYSNNDLLNSIWGRNYIGNYKAKRKILQSLLLSGQNQLGIESPNGILVQGSSGTGKSYLLRRIIELCNQKLIQVLYDNDENKKLEYRALSTLIFNFSKIYSPYFGETERRIRNLFEQARNNSPCLIVIDDIDNIARKRTALTDSNDSTGVDDRVVATLLNEMDGIDGNGGVRVISTTRDIQSIDEAILRSGRLSIHIELEDKPLKEEIKQLISLIIPQDTHKSTVYNQVVGLNYDGLTYSEVICKVRNSILNL